MIRSVTKPRTMAGAASRMKTHRHPGIPNQLNFRIQPEMGPPIAGAMVDAKKNLAMARARYRLGNHWFRYTMTPGTSPASARLPPPGPGRSVPYKTGWAFSPDQPDRRTLPN